MSSNGNGSHSICSFANSSQYAFGRISDRVDSVLADLDEAGAQILQHGSELFGREAFEEVVLAQDVGYLPQAAHARPAVQVEPVFRVDVRTGTEEVFEQRVLCHGQTALAGVGAGRGPDPYAPGV